MDSTGSPQEGILFMTPERAKLLGELLLEMRREGEYIPEESWLPLMDAVVTSWCEIVISRKVGSDWEILLTYRKDKNWDGWHIPGGLWKVQYPAFQDICNAIAKRELQSEVEFVRVVDVVKWTKHPFAHPLALLCLCSPRGEIQETETTKFFSKENVPENMVNEYHRQYVETIFTDLQQRGA